MRSTERAGAGVTKPLTVAAVDIGSNSTRLLVSRLKDEKIFTAERYMIITRLGEGVAESGMLDGWAIQRTSAALVEFRRVLDRVAPDGVAAVATAALRQCSNGEEFLDLAEEYLDGNRPRVLSAEEEAHASFTGALSGCISASVSGKTKTLAGGRIVLVFDIGGGSTEFIAGKVPDGRILDEIDVADLSIASVEAGCVSMSERFLSSHPPSGRAVEELERYLEGLLGPAVASLGGGPWQNALGLAGTVTTLSAIRMGLEVYDPALVHHSKLTRSQVEQVFQWLLPMSLDDKKQVTGLDPERADVILGGAAVLRVLMDLAGLEAITVSENDMLDGLALGLLRDLASGQGG